MNLALAHDYLIQMGGAERVVAAMRRAHPDAPIYTSAVNRRSLWPEFRGAMIRSTWMQHLPFITHHTHFKKYFLLYPSAFRSFRPVEADAVWISCSTFAKFLRIAPGTPSICYLHNTSRYLWQGEEYLRGEVRSQGLRRALGPLLSRLRRADAEAASRHTLVLANSANVQRRVLQNYGVGSEVLHPPVDAGKFSLSRRDDGFYLIVSRLLGYKNIDIAIRAFRDSGRRLVIVGEGPDERRLRAMAGVGTTFTGRLGDGEMARHYAECRALLLPGEEDFGITPLEAMACGKPVVALGRGGVLETVIPDETGVFFDAPSPAELRDAVERCESIRWDAERIRARSLEFAPERFIERMDAALRRVIARA